MVVRMRVLVIQVRDLLRGSNASISLSPESLEVFQVLWSNFNCEIGQCKISTYHMSDIATKDDLHKQIELVISLSNRAWCVLPETLHELDLGVPKTSFGILG